MDRGDIFSVDLEPTKGREQRGRRPVIVVTTKDFNEHNLPMICPITGGGVSDRLAGLTVPLAASGTRTDGVVLCAQLRVLDIKARHGRFVERAPDTVTDEVLATLQDIFD